MKINDASSVASFCLFIAAVLSTSSRLTSGFLICGGPTRFQRYTRIASTAENPSIASAKEHDDTISDADILEQTPQTMFVDLCERFGLSTEGSKSELLERLRAYGKEQVAKERERLADRKRRLEEGGDDSRERYEFIGDGDYEDDGEDVEEDVYFYYPSLLEDDQNTTNTTTNRVLKDAGDNERKTAKYRPHTQGAVTAPPPPDQPNENGERVVTVYSTKDQNDLTGVAAAQPGQASTGSMTSDIGEPENTPWDMTDPKKRGKSDTTIEAARNVVEELVQDIMARTGAPGFQESAEEFSNLGIIDRRRSYANPEGFIGFDPAQVPADLLTSASNSIRANRGEVLHEVLRGFELRAIGYDGTAGDNISRGGGHYKEVSKVRSFLEGFRRAEVRRLSRETTNLLLDKFVREGIEGLDLMLAGMTRSDDDTNDEAGELNDSLLEYLNSAIRQQEKKVEQIVKSSEKITEFERIVAEAPPDHLEHLWKVGSEDGKRVETFDPNDPISIKALREEYERTANEARAKIALPKSAAERLLMLLKLLRERIKIEAAFPQDEKSRNLRVLAYCMQLETDDLRKELLKKELGSSLDRFDSFLELVSSAIEYARSTSHQLYPSKQGSLDDALLKRVLAIAEETRLEQSRKSTGLMP